MATRIRRDFISHCMIVKLHEIDPRTQRKRFVRGIGALVRQFEKGDLAVIKFVTERFEGVLPKRAEPVVSWYHIVGAVCVCLKKSSAEIAGLVPPRVNRGDRLSTLPLYRCCAAIKMRLMLPIRDCYQPVDASRAIERYDGVAGLQQNPGGIDPTGGAPWVARASSRWIAMSRCRRGSFVVINLNLRSKLAHSLTFSSPVSR